MNERKRYWQEIPLNTHTCTLPRQAQTGSLHLCQVHKHIHSPIPGSERLYCTYLTADLRLSESPTSWKVLCLLTVLQNPEQHALRNDSTRRLQRETIWRYWWCLTTTVRRSLISALNCPQSYVRKLTWSRGHAGCTSFEEHKLMTCPCALIGHYEGPALGMALTHVNSFIDAEDWQQASVMLIGRPAAVVFRCYRGI